MTSLLDFKDCDRCGHHLQTVYIDGLNLCVICYADYIHDLLTDIVRKDEFGQRI